MAEVRPWLLASISLGAFHTTRDLQMIDISEDYAMPTIFLTGEPTPHVRERTTWEWINDAFSLPVTPSDGSTDYVPTQILAELFKRIGFEGILYKSSCTPQGVNVVLFDLDSAVLQGCGLFEAKKLTYSFSQIGNPYVVTAKRPKAKRRR